MKRRMAGVANPKLLQNLQKKRNSDPFFCLRMRLIQMNISSWLLMTASTSQPSKMTAFVSQKDHLNFVHFSNCGHRESNDKKRPGPSSQPQFRAGRRNIRAPRSPPPPSRTRDPFNPVIFGWEDINLLVRVMRKCSVCLLTEVKTPSGLLRTFDCHDCKASKP